MTLFLTVKKMKEISECEEDLNMLKNYEKELLGKIDYYHERFDVTHESRFAVMTALLREILGD